MTRVLVVYSVLSPHVRVLCVLQDEVCGDGRDGHRGGNASGV